MQADWSFWGSVIEACNFDGVPRPVVECLAAAEIVVFAFNDNSTFLVNSEADFVLVAGRFFVEPPSGTPSVHLEIQRVQVPSGTGRPMPLRHARLGKFLTLVVVSSQASKLLFHFGKELHKRPLSSGTA